MKWNWFHFLTLHLCAFFWVGLQFVAPAQVKPGALDPSFNPGDSGIGAFGVQGQVFTSAVQPDGKILIGGAFSAYNDVPRQNLARLEPDGRLDASFDPGGRANGSVNSISVQPDGKIVVGGEHYFRLMRLNEDGSSDTTFIVGQGPMTQNIGQARVYSTYVQSDGKILVAGWFNSFNGVSRPALARLLPNGSLDPTYQPSSNASFIDRVVGQPDGKALVIGLFTGFDGVLRNGIARLESDGSVDPDFDPGAALNGGVNELALLPDGRILLAGTFTTFGSTPCGPMVRVFPDGTLDTAFQTTLSGSSLVREMIGLPDGKVLLVVDDQPTGVADADHVVRLLDSGAIDPDYNDSAATSGTIHTLALQEGRGVVIAGSFGMYSGHSARGSITRLLANGDLDLGFNSVMGANGPVLCIAVQPDGRILIAGEFSSYWNATMRSVARAWPDGSPDASFNPGAGANGPVSVMALQPDGGIIVGGQFTIWDGIARRSIVRLRSDGSLDTTFNASLGGNSVQILALDVQPDGRLNIAGNFSSVGGVPRARLARLHPDGSLDTDFIPQITSVSRFIRQEDGMLVITGQTVAGGCVLSRIDRNGALDPNFNAGAGPDQRLSAMALCGDGKIMIAGYFSSYDGVARHGLARLHPNGRLDTSFDPHDGFGHPDMFGPVITSVVVQRDGRTLIGGDFSEYDHVPRSAIARLLPSGQLDTSFDPGTGADDLISAITSQPDGRILIGGYFKQYDGTPRSYVARLMDTWELGGNAPLMVYPDPVAPGGSMSIALDLPNDLPPGGGLTLELFDAIGRNVDEIRVAYRSSTVTMRAPGTIGTYTIVLRCDGRPVGSTKFVVY